MDNIDKEIEMLAKIYEKDTSPTDSSIISHKEAKNPQITQEVVKSRRRQNKRTCKEAIKRGEEMKNDKSLKSILDKTQELYEDPNEVVETVEYSEYSYPEISNMKLFTIEKIKKNRVPKRRQQMKARAIPLKLQKETTNVRKDSVATNASSMSATTLSPTKTASTVTLTPNLRNGGDNLHLRLAPSNEDGGVYLNNNGSHED
mmetsp:Transcript_14858/g.16570  ORF Transcript_14858/g.16570 Transcript_14858/m.16570 type:complete len:202 (-) Transcript_14858:445-1050(-)